MTGTMTRDRCHAGDCPQPELCGRKVTVRCGCRRIKRQWECSRVQQALASAPDKEQAAFRAVAVLAGSTPTAPSVVPCDEVRDLGDRRLGSKTLPSGAWGGVVWCAGVVVSPSV